MIGVTATERRELAVARLSARKGKLAVLRDSIRGRFGIELPEGPRRVHNDRVAFIGVGQETWLASLDTGSDERALNGFAALLRDVVDRAASVSDQIGTYNVVRLSGPRVRDALAKLIPLDLHSRVFTVGAAASTVASHVPVTLWRLEDDADSSVFELAVPRSYAGHFHHGISESAAEFGFSRSGMG